MNNTVLDNPAYRQARRHVERKIGFAIHLAVYLVVNCGLVLLNMALSHGRWWAFAPLFGWGIGVLFHGLAVLLRTPGATWKQRMIEKELHRQTPSA